MKKLNAEANASLGSALPILADDESSCPCVDARTTGYLFGFPATPFLSTVLQALRDLMYRAPPPKTVGQVILRYKIAYFDVFFPTNLH